MGLPIPGYPDYLIEKDGQIFSLKTNKWLKANIGNTGYYGIELANDKGHKRLSIHRLVALTYIPNPNNLPQVNHKDENKLNNNVNNLEWCTNQYNMTYGTFIERRVAHTDYSKPSYRENAIKNGKKVSRPVTRYSISGQYIDSFESAADAKRKLNLISNHISECASGKRSTAHGYVWKYERSEDLSDFQF